MAVSGAVAAAVATWVAQLPGRRRAVQRLQTARTRLRDAEVAQRDAESRTSAGTAATAELRAQWQRQLDQARTDASGNWQYAQLVIGEVEHFVERRLPAAVQEIRGVPVRHEPGLRHSSLEGSEIAGYLAVLDTLLRQTAADVRRQAEEAAGAGVRVAAEEIQAALTRAQRDIDAALDADEDQGAGSTTPQALARIDHAVTLAGHTVQRLRILANSWPGVQRANCSVLEIIESARGQIPHLDAVEYVFQSETADVLVEGLIVEPVIVALTELLDNATSYSGEKASTYVQRVRAGIRITVEDSGLGMSPLQLERAERALASGGADVTALAEPFSLGFLVIGRLIHQYNLRVTLSPSASGGVRADLLIPAERLAADADEDGPARRAGAAAPSAAQLRPVPPPTFPAADTAAGAETVPAPRWSSGGHERPTPDPVHDAPAEPPPQAAAGMGPAQAHSLPKRQPRRARPQDTAPRQHAISDPEAAALTKGFEQISHILAEGFGTEHTTEG
ncbi:ATP-binding protein [Streptomyces prunicolor]|uniref:ATP-binding protein n=1 Tax=Streptomyces prunicolor TaxID=67348 RepID=UPI00370FC650